MQQAPDLAFASLIQRRAQRAFELYYTCRSGTISSQMSAQGRPILAGWAEGMWEMAL